MLRGGSRPVNLALAVALGLAIGFTAGWNFTVVALLMLAALTNANSKLLAASTMSGAVLAWLASSMTSAIGTLIYDETRLATWVTMLGDGPLAAMFDLDSYCLIGGLVLAFSLAGPLGRAAWQWGESRWVDEEPSNGQRREGLMRPRAWLALPLVLLFGGALPWWLGTRHLERRVLTLLSDFNGAEVSASRVRLELWSGRLELDGLEIPDPANLERDRLRIAQVRARVRGGPLLRGRLEIERLQLSGIDRDVARRKAATAVAARIPQIRFSPAPLALPADVSQELELHDYVRGWDQFASRLSHLGQLLAALERIRSLEPDRLQRTSAATLFGSAERSNLGSPQPALAIEHIEAEGFGESWGLGKKSLVELKQLSTNPKLAKGPPALRIVLPELAAEVSSTLDFLKPGQRHRVQLQVGDLPLVSLIEQSSGGSRIAVADGRVNISGEGWMDDTRFDLALQMQISGLDARLQGSAPAAGIAPAAWNRGLKDLGGLRAELTCNGRWASPRLHVQGRDLVNQFKHQLRSAGDHVLLAQIEKQLAAPTQVVPTVTVTDSASSPVELPHPLPNPNPAVVPPVSAPISQSVEQPRVEQLPPPTTTSSIPPQATTAVSDSISAPPANLPPATVAAVPLLAAVPVSSYSKTMEPAAPPAMASDSATPLAQPIEQSRASPPTVAQAPRTEVVAARPSQAPSGVVTVSDELFGPPPLAVPAVGRYVIPPEQAATSNWQPPATTAPPSYHPPQAPVVTYTPPAAQSAPQYSAPRVASAQPTYKAPAAAPTVPAQQTYSPPVATLPASSRQNYAAPSTAPAAPAQQSYRAPAAAPKAPAQQTYSPPVISLPAPTQQNYPAPTTAPAAPAQQAYRAPAAAPMVPAQQSYAPPVATLPASSRQTYAAPTAAPAPPAQQAYRAPAAAPIVPAQQSYAAPVAMLPPSSRQTYAAPTTAPSPPVQLDYRAPAAAPMVQDQHSYAAPGISQPESGRQIYSSAVAAPAQLNYRAPAAAPMVQDQQSYTAPAITQPASSRQYYDSAAPATSVPVQSAPMTAPAVPAHPIYANRMAESVNSLRSSPAQSMPQAINMETGLDPEAPTSSPMAAPTIALRSRGSRASVPMVFDPEVPSSSPVLASTPVAAPPPVVNPSPVLAPPPVVTPPPAVVSQPAVAPPPVVASKPKRPSGPGIPTPKMTDMNDPMRKPTFFYSPNKTATKKPPPPPVAKKAPEESDAEVKTATKAPWYKKFF
jgi:hypothetical protein